VKRNYPGPSVSESPWFWVMVFSLAALMGLATIGPKYAQRQAGVERRFEARQEAARRETRPQPDLSQADAEYLPAEQHLKVPLWRLAAVLIAVSAISGAGLWRSQRKLRVRHSGERDQNDMAR
jgi:hypothetical protein